MMFIELFVPKGALDADKRREPARRLITDFMTEDEMAGAPQAVIRSAYEIEQVVVHEIDTWVVGDRAIGPDEPPRYVVRVTVPNSWRKQMAGEIIERYTRILAAFDNDAERLYREPHSWVQVVGLSENSVGSFGRALSSDDITGLITKPFRESPDRDEIVKSAPPGMAVDPICGMTVPLEDAVTLEHDGVTYGFCCGGCRAAYSKELAAAAS